LVISLALGLSLSLVLTLPTPCEAAKLDANLTAKDRSQAELLDQNGNLLLNLGSSHHLPSVLPSGSTPAYVAYPLLGGEHLPFGLVTLTSNSQSGETTVGPLNFDSTLKASLDAALTTSASRMAVVDTPQQNYLVEYLPRYARSLHGSTTGANSTTSSTGQTAIATQSTNAGSNASLTSDLTRLLNKSSSTLSSLSSKGIADIEHILRIKSSKPTATKPSLNLEAQVLSSSPQPLPSPIPEPSTWLVFSLILGAAGLRQRLRRRSG
jgi:hypothetical protein